MCFSNITKVISISKIRVVKYFTLAFILSYISYFLFQQRNEYLSLYQPQLPSFFYSDIVYLRSIKIIHHNKIAILFGGIRPGDTFSSQTGRQVLASQNQLEIDLLEGDNRITVYRNGTFHDFAVFEYTSPTTYLASNNSKYSKGKVILKKSSLSFGNHQPEAKTWFQPTISFNQKTLSKLKTSLGISERNSPHELLVGILKWLEFRRGTPSQEAEESTVDKLFTLLDEGKSQAWCSNMALISRTTLNSFSIPSRIVGTTGGAIGDANLGGHVFNEIYNESHNNWQFIDLYNRIVEISDRQGHVYSALDMHNALTSQGQTSKKDLFFTLFDPNTGTLYKQSWEQIPSQLKEDIEFYFDKDNKLIYFKGTSNIAPSGLKDKLTNYLLGDGWYLLAESTYTSPWISVYSFVKILNALTFLSWAYAFALLTFYQLRPLHTVKPNINQASSP